MNTTPSERMRGRLPVAVASLLSCLAAGALALVGCGGDAGEPPTPPGGPPRVTIAGRIALPPGCTADPATLTVLNALDSALADNAGDFAVDIYRADRLLASVLAPGGAPLLMGWLQEGRATLDARSTAEVLVYFTLSAWTLPATAADSLRGMIAALGPELDALTAAIAAEVVARPGGLTTPSAALHDALAATVAALRDGDARRAVLAGGGGGGGADPPPLLPAGILVEPAAQASGCEVLNQGGVNRVTLKNSWRRRGIAFLRQTGWVDAGGIAHPTPDAPDSVLEVEAVAGFSGTISTIGSWFTGDIAYTPKETEAQQLARAPGARHTDYEIVIGGAGGAGNAAGASVTPERLPRMQDTALKGVAWDFFLPLLMNVVATRGALAEVTVLEDNPGFDWPGLAGWINWIGTNYPGVAGNAWHGNYRAALLELWSGVTATGDFQTITLGFFDDLFRRLGVEAGYAGTAIDAAKDYLAIVGWIDIVGTYLDNTATLGQILAAHQADRWEVRVTDPAVHLGASPTRLAQYDEADSLTVTVADAGDTPEGWAWAYRWRCPGTAGTLINPVDPGDRSNDFQTSSRRVGYAADRGGAGGELVTVTAYLKLGAELTPVGSDTLTIHVTTRAVTLAPATTNVAADAVRWFEAKCDPPLPAGAPAVYAWSGGGSAGTLRASDNTPAPCESGDPAATYHAGLAQGSDQVQVTVYRLLEGGSRREIGRATAQATVRPDMIEGRLIGTAIYDLEHSFCSGPVYVEFARRPGVTHYFVHGYNYHDFTGYYGDEYREYGPPFDSRDSQTESVYRIFLTGLSTGCDPNNPPSEEELLGWNMSRFRGSVWEVWPQN